MNPPPDSTAKSNGANILSSGLTNVLQILTGTSAQIQNVWEGRDDADKYFGMLQASIERAEFIAAELVKQAGDPNGKGGGQTTGARFAPNQEPVALATRRCVLVVDDEPMTLTLFTHLLTDAGFDVVCAQSGFQCLDLFSRHSSKYDLVILDFAMPFMDGAETFERLRAISPALPVVLVTGFIEQTKLQAMFAKGLAGYLRKPFAPDETITCVRDILSGEPPQNVASGITAAI